MLNTEIISPAHADLDTLSPLDMVRRFISDQHGALQATRAAADSIGAAKAERDLPARAPTPRDVVISIAACGRTPYAAAVLRATNAKLMARATGRVMRLIGAQEAGVAQMPQASGLEVKTAAVALSLGLSPTDARALQEAA